MQDSYKSNVYILMMDYMDAKRLKNNWGVDVDFVLENVVFLLKCRCENDESLPDGVRADIEKFFIDAGLE